MESGDVFDFLIKKLIPTRLISAPCGRFPWARLQSPRHFVPPGFSARAVPTGKIRTNGFGANLCDEASAALQEQVFYAPCAAINDIHLKQMDNCQSTN